MEEHEYQHACFVPGCRQLFKTEGGRKRHAKAKHPYFLKTAQQFDLCKQADVDSSIDYEDSRVNDIAVYQTPGSPSRVRRDASPLSIHSAPALTSPSGRGSPLPSLAKPPIDDWGRSSPINKDNNLDPLPHVEPVADFQAPAEGPEDIAMQLGSDAHNDVNADSRSSVPPSPTTSSLSFSSGSSSWSALLSEDDDFDNSEPENVRSDLARAKNKYHPTLSGILRVIGIICFQADLISGTICDSNGCALPVGTPPSPETRSHQDWTPFDNRVQFELGNFLYRKVQMSAGDIDTLLQLWAESHKDCGCPAPFQNHRETYQKIDSIKVGDVPWDSFTLRYEGEQPELNTPPWMKTEYQVWYRDPRLVIKNIFSNPDFKDGIDYAPYISTNADNNRIYHNFMSGEWAWERAVCSLHLPLHSYYSTPYRIIYKQYPKHMALC